MILKKYKAGALALALLTSINACTDPDELVTTDAKVGGLLVPASSNLSYVLNNTPSLDIVIEVPKGPGVESIKLYKSFCMNCNDDELQETSGEVLALTLPVNGENVGDAKEVSVNQTYASLKEGITFEDGSLPEDESDLVIGDYWLFRLVSVMEDGRELRNNSTITVAVANLYSGSYHSEGKFVHPTAGPRDINRAKTLAPIDAQTCETEYADLGGNGWKMWLRVNPDDNSVEIIPIAPASPGTVPNGDNFYDPATKSFTLNYKYAGAGGDRVVSEVITKDE